MGSLSQPKFLVLTLYSGENEFDACQKSVADQLHVDVEQVAFKGLGNLEAHRRLYSEIMARAPEFDLFLKLDADMVLSRNTALYEIAEFFAARPELDHLETEVNDHFTGAKIFGVHVFSPRVTWQIDTHDPLFVDPEPTCPGSRARSPSELDIFVEHAPDPGPYQAFHFGFHRALKAFQFNVEHRSLSRMEAQLAILQDLERHYETTKRASLGLSIIAADMVMNGRLNGETGDKSDTSVETAFEKVSQLTPSEVHKQVRQGRSTRKFTIWKERTKCRLKLWKHGFVRRFK